MDNVSKALVIAAAVLVAIILIAYTIKITGENSFVDLIICKSLKN